MINIYKSFANSTKKKVLPYVMTGVTLLGIPTLTRCAKEPALEGTSFSEDYLDSINAALNSEDCNVIYNEDQDNYIIDYNEYIYDINDSNYRKLIGNKILTMSGVIARAYGYTELLNAKIKTYKK